MHSDFTKLLMMDAGKNYGCSVFLKGPQHTKKWNVIKANKETQQKTHLHTLYYILLRANWTFLLIEVFKAVS